MPDNKQPPFCEFITQPKADDTERLGRLSPDVPAKRDVINGHITNGVHRFVCPQGGGTVAVRRPSESNMNSEVSLF